MSDRDTRFDPEDFTYIPEGAPYPGWPEQSDKQTYVVKARYRTPDGKKYGVARVFDTVEQCEAAADSLRALPMATEYRIIDLTKILRADIRGFPYANGVWTRVVPGE